MLEKEVFVLYEVENEKPQDGDHFHGATESLIWVIWMNTFGREWLKEDLLGGSVVILMEMLKVITRAMPLVMERTKWM